MAIDLNTDLRCSRARNPVMTIRSSLGPDVTMTMGGSSGHSDQHGCITGAWLQVAAHTLYSPTAFGRNRIMNINTDPGSVRPMNADMVRPFFFYY